MKASEVGEIIGKYKDPSKVVEILRKAATFQEKKDPHGYGWRWFDIQASPQIITRLVQDGLVVIRRKTASKTKYKLVSPKLIKEGIGEYWRSCMESWTGRKSAKPTSKGSTLPKNFLRGIEGYDSLKRFMLKSLGTGKDKRINVLFYGPPGTAKSLFLMELQRIPDAYFCDGSKTSGVGLDDILLERRPSVLVIDEVDKMNRKDTSALLLLCENGMVCITKHHKKVSETLSTRVFIACNNKEALTKAFQDRFDSFYLREYTDEEYLRIVPPILMDRCNISKKLAAHIAKRSLAELGKSVRQAIRMGHICANEKDVEDFLDTKKRYREEEA